MRNGEMKMRARAIVGGVIAGLACAACGGSDGATEPPAKSVASVALAPGSTTMLVGATTQLTAKLSASDGTTLTGRAITWSSSSSAVTVSSTGMVTGVAAGGPATITAMSESVSGTAQVTVLPLVASVGVTPASMTMVVGETTTLIATVRDDAGGVLTGRQVQWASSASAIATVSTTGVVTAIAAGGPLAITATSEGKVGTAQVTVVPPGTRVAAGIFHTCALRASGAANCWGSNLYGQLGDGTTSERLIPTAVAGGLSFTSLTTGNFHTCAIDRAGVAYCWGRNPDGQLGIGSTGNRSVPAAVSGGLSFKSIVANGDYVSTLQALNAGHTCGLTTSGAAYCWGYGRNGQLGDGAAQDRSTPTAVAGTLSFAQIAAGPRTTCGVTSDGVAYCWGFNGDGEVGDGTEVTRASPVPVSGGLRFRALSSGGGLLAHTCGVATSGAAFCWGANFDGELGDGTTTSRLVPTAVGGGLTFVAITTGGWAFEGHTCGLTAAGAAYCWGANDEGQLGNGSTLASVTPRPVAGGLTFTSITARWNQTCAMTAAGAVYCWGQNDAGQLGDGTRTNRGVPTLVALPSP
jgi:alpha-tubulin suppressor-like RCC1 family protein